jgi:FdhD protein
VSDRPRVAISSCLLGERVRWDAGHKRDDSLIRSLGPLVDWVPVCPEVEAGFGAPRESMQLVRNERGGVALVTTGTARDITSVMRRYAARRIDELAEANLDGYIFKADSPSCGIEGVPVVGAPGEAEASGLGLFAEALMARLPQLPIDDERRLSAPAARERFLARVVAHHRARFRHAGGAAWRRVDVIRVRDGARTMDADRAATEEPLEVRLHGRPFAVVMRTPGADRELAAGFLLAEGVITGADDLGTIEHCRDRRPEADAGLSEGRENIVDVTLTDTSRLDRLLADRRQVTTNSSCGLCGRQTIESLTVNAGPIEARWAIPASMLSACVERLRLAQAVFEETGGLHAAGLFTRGSDLVQVAEDVGRHNAVDKVVGRMLMRDALPLSDYMLIVSGRTSFEIVQKAFLAGIPIVAAVSAPSSLAIELARDANITLVGFLRGDRFNIYTHAERIST